ncbi:hypothetical protein BU16DRAFT_456137 [Lophium mytilinum]|uniref:Exonuclease domain-containing protein n=1 Tax=Lophium mytilinum TaxID=390894 RepID=A0A6A6R4B0_9PEZI|nr:hypothetical protein BU16DRAFT_456137 [Lophium mytilinum]
MLKGSNATSPDSDAVNQENGEEDGWQKIGKNGRPVRPEKRAKSSKGSYPAITHSSHARIQNRVRISDLQTLALYLLADDGPAPQWISCQHHHAVKKVVVLMVPGLEAAMFDGKIPLESPQLALESFEDGAKSESAEHSTGSKSSGKHQPDVPQKRLHISPDDYYPVKLKSEQLPEPLKPLAAMFPHIWPVRTPGDEKTMRIHSPMQAMLSASIPLTPEEKLMKKDKRHKGPIPQNNKVWKNERTAITEYVASLPELQENEYVIHPAWFTTGERQADALAKRKAAKQSADHGWVDTNVSRLEDGEVPEKEIESGSITAGRNVITMDCEMCRTEEGTELTRISLVSWDGAIIMDELVKPASQITDYLTAYSGITQELLQNVTTSLSDIQARLLELITPRTILVGHSLNSDMNALKMTHPFIVDTSIIYPHARGPPFKQSLKWLSQKYLSREIQKNHGQTGHDSNEDARACLDLVRQKCEKGPKWGTSEATTESIFKRLGRAPRPHHLQANGEEFRSGAVVDWGDPSRGYGALARVAIGCENDADVVAGIKRAIEGQDLDEAPAGGVDFVWGRLRELEAKRGWWTRSKTDDNAELRDNAMVSSSGVKDAAGEASGPALYEAVAKTVGDIAAIFESLPPCTAFMVYSGTGDPRETARLQAMQQQYRKEYQIKKWDQLSVKWTDREEQALRKACWQARDGIGFVVVK